MSEAAGPERAAAAPGADDVAVAGSHARRMAAEEGQRLYLEACCPEELATMGVDTNVLDAPKLLG